jgi:hypothetical protein
MSDDRIFTCSECGAEISAEVESTPKAFNFHIKREHRGELQNLDGLRDRPYRGFIDQEGIDKIRGDDVPI